MKMYDVFMSDGNDRTHVDSIEAENIDEAIERAFHIHIKESYHEAFENVEQGDPEFGVVHQMDVCHHIGNVYCEEESCEDCEYTHFEFLEIVPVGKG